MVVFVAVQTVGGRHDPSLTDQTAPTEGREGWGPGEELGRGTGPTRAVNDPGGEGKLPGGPASSAAEHGVVRGELGTVVSSTHDPLNSKHSTLSLSLITY